MAKFKFTLWLAYWYLQAENFEFQWDQGNSTKSVVKHGVTTEEVESVLTLKMAVPIGRQVSPAVDEERLCVVGPSQEGRMLSIVFTLRDGRVRPISSRIANRNERRRYEEIRKTIQKL
ncbi:MAG: BrnT family toxin [Deltaproteobacteria bacterium]|nr:BrnT family toxin [Deltaproteobacteria bacterium]